MFGKLTTEQRITRARISLLVDYPFFGTLLAQLPMVEATKETGIDTMATDGRRIFWNREFTEKLSDEELKGVLAHEVAHPALLHLWRRGGRDPQKWNVAADLSINHALEQDGLKLPAGACLYSNPQFKDLTPGSSAEANYEKMPPNPTSQSWGDHSLWGASDGSGDGDSDVPADGDGAASEGSDLGGDSLADKWKQMTTTAAQTARQQGKLPAGLERAINDLLHPTLPWQEMLERYCQVAKDDYSFTPPDRRFASEDFYLPDLADDPALYDVVAAVDTSGSFSEQEIRDSVSEIQGILKGFAEVTGHLALCDAAVHHWGPIHEMPKKIGGGGGTDFRPVFDRVRKEGMTNVAVLIYFTDGYGSYPETPPNYPVIWVCTTDYEGPGWGIWLRYRRD